MLVIIIYGYSDVHLLALDRRLEYFNDSSIILCVYHCFLFTDFVDDPIARYQIGYSFIATVLFCWRFQLEIVVDEPALNPEFFPKHLIISVQKF